MHLLDFPFVVLAISAASMWLATCAGIGVSARLRPMEREEREYFTVVLTAALTLLGLIIGFTFSMAVSHYDLRKHYEEAEANAISTESARAELFPADNSSQIKELLKKYVELRVLFYTAPSLENSGKSRLHQLNIQTEQLQAQMWSLVRSSRSPSGTATTALVASGMNEVIDFQGYAQAASRNRVPDAAWTLMVVIAICCNFLAGFGAYRVRGLLIIILPTLIAISFFLIADIDSPRGGLIRVHPENLLSVAQILNAH
jgi:hypothetical protein